jgi:UDP-4-amino-4,6-dideoxy-N-acetyl-beta-L-altrosamine transaminase
MLPYGRQTIDEDDIAAVVRTLRSDFLTCGPEVEAFENEFAEFVGAKHAVAVANATDALHLAMLVAGIGPGDRVVTSPNTFLASANCAAFVGATPDFCDINPVSYNLDPVALERDWKPGTKAVIAVAYAGQAANMPEIARIARERNAIVIEDACHGTGGGFTFEGREWKLGGHPWADITTFSFHPVKTLTTGEGGMLVTDNAEFARRARQLRAHGIERDSSRFQGFGSENPAFAEKGPWVYEMQELGYNHRITDIQCALGRSQLRKLPQFIRRRLEIVAHYNHAFAKLPWLTTPKLAPWLSPNLPSPTTNLQSPISNLPSISWHLYTVLINFESLGKTRTEVMAELRSQGVGSQVLYIPVHLQPWYRKTYGYGHGKCPVAEKQYGQSLSLPLYPAMTDEDADMVVRAIRSLSLSITKLKN